MKWRKISSFAALAVLASCLFSSGCGSKNNGAIVITVSVISSAGRIR